MKKLLALLLIVVCLSAPASALAESGAADLGTYLESLSDAQLAQLFDAVQAEKERRASNPNVFDLGSFRFELPDFYEVTNNENDTCLILANTPGKASVGIIIAGIMDAGLEVTDENYQRVVDSLASLFGLTIVDSMTVSLADGKRAQLYNVYDINDETGERTDQALLICPHKSSALFLYGTDLGYTDAGDAAALYLFSAYIHCLG